MERKFGRIYEPDERDFNFALSKKPLSSNKTKAFYYTEPAYDQGVTPQCVAYAGLKWLDTAPVRNRIHNFPLDFTTLYQKCQKNDRWPGENYEGTSVRALFKVLKQMGFVSRYEWAFDLETVVNHVLTTGPMVVGTWWYEDMMHPDNFNMRFVRPYGRAVGGHAYIIKGVNTRSLCPDGSRGAFRIMNSWGQNWGLRGCASISFKDFDRLLQANGEVCTATEILVK